MLTQMRTFNDYNSLAVKHHLLLLLLCESVSVVAPPTVWGAAYQVEACPHCLMKEY